MKDKRNRATIWLPILTILTILTLLTSFFPSAETQRNPKKRHNNPKERDHTQSELDFFPLTGSGISQCDDMVIDKSGTVWIKNQRKILFLSGEEFKDPLTEMQLPHPYPTGLFGGSDRGAFATFRGKTDNEGLLYELNRDKVKYINTFYRDRYSSQESIYISKSGRIFNWGDRFLALYDGEQWNRIEARLSNLKTIIFDLGQETYFYYNNSLYFADASGSLKERACAPWRGVDANLLRVGGVLWGDSKALLTGYGQIGLFAFDLKTGKEVDLAATNEALMGRMCYDIFSLKNTGAWVLGSSSIAGYSYYHVRSDGETSEVPGTSGLPWSPSRDQHFPESVLETQDGSILFGLATDGLVVFRNGEVSRWGWQHGLAKGVQSLHQDKNGDIWFSQGEKIARLHLGASPLPINPLAGKWQEYSPSKSYKICKLSSGIIVLLSEEAPIVLLRWDGKEFERQEIPFDLFGLTISAIDDRDHVMLLSQNPRGGCYDIGPDTIEHFKSWQDLVAAAVGNGARKFMCNDTSQDIVVTSQGRIWLKANYQNSIPYFDGKRWDNIKHEDYIMGIFESMEHGIIFQTRKKYFYTYDRGQFSEVSPSLFPKHISQISPAMRFLMLGERGLQPYERNMIDENPGQYYPAVEMRSRRGLLPNADLYELWNSGYMDIMEKHRLLIPYSYQWLRPADTGGAWIHTASHQNSPIRLFGGELLAVETTGTPLEEKNILDIKEDLEGGLWFLTSAPGAKKYQNIRLYYRKPIPFELKLETPPQKCDRTLNLGLSMKPEGVHSKVRLFARLNNLSWNPVESDGAHCVLHFPKSGKYTCEIAALNSGGRLKTTASFTIRANVSLPETILEEKENKTLLVDTIEWNPPVSIRKSQEGASATLRWRSLDGPWLKLSENESISMANIEPGVHTLEISAQEENYWHDATPVRIQIEYQLDLQNILTHYLTEAMNPNLSYIDREESKKKLMAHDTDALLPIVQEKLKQAQEAARQVSYLSNLHSTLSRKKPSQPTSPSRPIPTYTPRYQMPTYTPFYRPPYRTQTRY